jgi:predicted ribosome quality control (RQC) complex YloA/Tae2 family protein
MARLLLSFSFVLTANLIGAPAAWADICMYETAEGEVTYSNVTVAPPKNARKIRCFKEEKEPAASSEQTQTKKETSSNFPSVDRETQRKRDDERRIILEQELAAEQKRLTAARQQMEEQESVRLDSERNYQRYLDRVQPFRDTVENHERNIQAIQSEINNLR